MGQRMIVGLRNGQIVILRVSGYLAMQICAQSVLSFHDSPVLFLQENGNGQFMASLAEDEILFVWKHIETKKQGQGSVSGHSTPFPRN